MRIIRYSPEYKEKIQKLRKYLDSQFGENVRKRVLEEINKRIKMLQGNERMGVSVKDVYGIECDYFCIYVARNYIFYKIQDNQIYILNMYNDKEDFMRKVFGIRTIREDTEDYWEE